MIIRGFHYSSKAWYAKANEQEGVVDSIMVGYYDTDGGTAGEFEIIWSRLAGKLVYIVKSYSDSLNALTGFSDVLATAKDGMTADEFVTHLKECHVEDLTEYKRG